MMGFRRDEELRRRRMNRATLRRVLGYVRPYRLVLGGFLATVVADSIVTAIPPLILRAVIDTAIPEKNRTLVAVLAVAAIVWVFTTPESDIQPYDSSSITPM